jgi:hypothetical protein
MNLSFIIRLILEKVELSCSLSWLRSFVHTLRSLIEIHRIGLDPVTTGQFDSHHSSLICDSTLGGVLFTVAGTRMIQEGTGGGLRSEADTP